MCLCVLFVLPVICLQLEKQRFFDGIKTRKNSFFERLELDLFGDLCYMKHHTCACPSLMEATLLKGVEVTRNLSREGLEGKKHTCLLLEC